jgi:glycosyltransferase involved in cell wall biosynthesis
MRVNFFVEDMLFFKYIGCATVAKTLYNELKRCDDLDMSWKAYRAPFDIVHYHTFGPLALLNRRLADGKKVLTAHSTPRINEGNIRLSRTINRYYPKIYRKFDHIVTISKPCHDEVGELVPDVPITLIPNGVDRKKFRPLPEKRAKFRDRFGIPEDALVVLTVAQQTPRKGIYDFLELARAFPDRYWVWVGGFPYGTLSKGYMHIQMAKQKCGKNVIFTGYIKDITEAYCGADIFFMPSYAETFGLVVLEALASGLPVIARDIPEFRDIFAENILYFSESSEIQARLQDHDTLRRSGAGARPFTEAFDIRSIAKQHQTLYRELIGP